MVQFGLNGAMFVLLGEQLPSIARSAGETMREAGTAEPVMLLVYIVVITAAMIALRLAWVWVSFRFTLFRRRHAGQELPSIDPASSS
jgi:CPA1 family monovalent cation:H+ antiporter